MDGREDEEIERIRSRIAALEAERVELEAALAEGVRRPLAA
jgi:hypothetical protein